MSKEIDFPVIQILGKVFVNPDEAMNESLDKLDGKAIDEFFDSCLTSEKLESIFIASDLGSEFYALEEKLYISKTETLLSPLQLEPNSCINSQSIETLKAKF